MDTISYKDAKKLSKEEFEEYALRDAEFAYQLYFWEKEKLEAENYYDLVSGLEMDFDDVLISMTLHGTCTDLEFLKQGEEILTNKAIELEAQIYKEYGEFNLGSPMQLVEKIFGIKISRKNKTVTMEQLPGEYAIPTKMTKPPKTLAPGKTHTPVPSTDDEALTNLDTPVAKLIKHYRSVTKCLDTYAKGYQKWVIDGRIWPSFNHVGTVTGRISSEKPNMMNLPHDPTEGWWIKEGIYAPEGYDLVVADESQLEVRLLAHFSQDENLMAAIWSGEDVHLATAKLIFLTEDISSDQRYFAKTTNFSMSYGQGIDALGTALNCPREEAYEFRKHYFITFPGVKAYINAVGDRVQARGYVCTYLGRKRRLPEIDIALNDKTLTEKEFNAILARAKRQAVNSIIQGSASDVLKVAMVHINKEFLSKKLDAHILLQIHDELVIECKHEISEEVVEITRRHMEQPFHSPLRVPLKTVPVICNKWSEGKKD